jgi:hypothetical protein
MPFVFPLFSRFPFALDFLFSLPCILGKKEIGKIKSEEGNVL